MFTKEYKVYIDGTKDVFTVKGGINLYKFLREKGIMCETLCKGQAQCGRCKVFVRSASGKDINKPTKKERLMLASVNLESGYRLACQYAVKTDIFVKIEKNDTNADIDILSVKFRDKDKEKKKILESFESIEEAVEILEDETIYKKEENDLLIEEEAPILKTDTVIKTEEPKKSSGVNSKESFDFKAGDYNPTDGLILLPYDKGIKYYIYSAGINNISSEGLIKTDEALVDIIDNNLISDFIYNNIHIGDIERLIVVLDKKYYNGIALFNLINYYTFNVGPLLCEIIQPENAPLDMLLFFRLLYNNKKRNILISMESLGKIFYFDDSKLIEVSSVNKVLNDGFQQFLNHGRNPILFINSNLEVALKDKYEMPDSISFAAILHLAKYLLKEGVMTEDFLLKDRNELIDIVPIDKLVKLSNVNGKKLFYIYRRKNTELYIDQVILDLFFIFRSYINLILKLAKTHLKRIDNIYLFTMEKYDNFVNEFLDLKMISVEHSKRIVYSPGDPTILVSKFFQYKSIKDYLAEYISDYNVMNIDKTSTFKDFEDFISKREILKKADS
jgi:ferredoxin